MSNSFKLVGNSSIKNGIQFKCHDLSADKYVTGREENAKQTVALRRFIAHRITAFSSLAPRNKAIGAFRNMANNESAHILSKAERACISILLVEPDPHERNLLRTTLRSLGFSVVSDSPNHIASLEKFEGRKFSHVIFDAKKGNYPIKEWFTQILEIAPNIIGIPTSANPNVDDVFELLLLGAKGYLVKPFTRESVDLSVMMATKGEPIPDIVRQARDRNEALVAIIMSSLDRLATVYRQSKQFETAERELPRAMEALRRSSDLALTFAKGGEDGLIDALERFCVEKSRGPATRLGRLRKRLSTTRGADEVIPE